VFDASCRTTILAYFQYTLPVAFTTIVPVGTAQVGCVNSVVDFIVGGTGTVLITIEFPLYTVTQLDALKTY